jgi:hypothetical protein
MANNKSDDSPTAIERAEAGMLALPWPPWRPPPVSTHFLSFQSANSKSVQEQKIVENVESTKSMTSFELRESNIVFQTWYSFSNFELRTWNLVFTFELSTFKLVLVRGPEELVEEEGGLQCYGRPASGRKSHIEPPC